MRQLLAASGFGAIRDDNTGPITNLVSLHDFQSAIVTVTQ